MNVAQSWQDEQMCAGNQASELDGMFRLHDVLIYRDHQRRRTD